MPISESLDPSEGLLQAFYRNEFPLFVVVPIGKSVEAITFNDLTKRKRQEGLAILSWREMDSAKSYVKDQLHAEALLQVAKLMGKDISSLCARSNVNQKDVMFELL